MPNTHNTLGGGARGQSMNFHCKFVSNTYCQVSSVCVYACVCVRVCVRACVCVCVCVCVISTVPNGHAERRSVQYSDEIYKGVLSYPLLGARCTAICKQLHLKLSYRREVTWNTLLLPSNHHQITQWWLLGQIIGLSDKK